MARLMIPFEVSLTGGTGISINDPFFGVQEDLANQRLRIGGISGQQELSLQQQRLLQLLQNQGVSGTGVYGDVIVNPDPAVTPFPIGCPSGMFQEGNVCVPIIGTYPDETWNAPPAGVPGTKGVIDHVEGPNMTRAGADAEVRIFLRNQGYMRGKFQARLSIPTWSIDTLSVSGWVPQYTPAIATIKFKVPATAVLGTGTIPGTIELQVLDEVTREFKISDVSSYNFPQPQETGTTPPEDDCFTYNNKEYCLTDTPVGTDCIEIGDKIYCAAPPQCFTVNNIQYCKVTTPSGSGCIQIGSAWYCPSTTPPPQTECFTFNNMQYCTSDEITSPNCVTVGNKIFCPVPPCAAGQHVENGYCVPDTQCLNIGGIEMCESTTWKQGCIYTGGKIYCPKETAPDCITVGGVQMCVSQHWRTGCIYQNGKIYCPEETPHPPPPEHSAYIMAPDSARDGDSFDVRGFNFKPGEYVDIVLYVVWQGRSYDGKTDTQSRHETADYHGEWKEQMHSEEVPSGVSGMGTLTAIGRTSGKTATRTIAIL